MSSTNLEIPIHLPSHERVLKALVEYFEKAGATAAFLSGSTATGSMDTYSDVDLGIVCKDARAMDELWSLRWQWDFHSWGHRFDADHIKEHFVIYLFNGEGDDEAELVKADIAFYTLETLPSSAGAPYRVLWDKSGKLAEWVKEKNGAEATKPNWDDVNHEDERFWAWLVYLMLHAYRGELFEAAESVAMVRNVTMTWFARLAGNASFNPRRLEERASVDELTQFYHFFPMPSRQSIGCACLALIDLHKELRDKVSKEAEPEVVWNTSEEFCARVMNMAQGLSDWES